MKYFKGKLIQRVAVTSLMACCLAVGAGDSKAGEPAAAMKAKEVRELVSTASTKAEHMKLAQHFHAMAKSHEDEALEHESLAAAYMANPKIGSTKNPLAPDTAAHCRYFAEHCRKAAKEMHAMAAAHEAMARDAGK